jgi:hypothetical protein
MIFRDIYEMICHELLHDSCDLCRDIKAHNKDIMIHNMFIIMIMFLEIGNA